MGNHVQGNNLGYNPRSVGAVQKVLSDITLFLSTKSLVEAVGFQASFELHFNGGFDRLIKTLFCNYFYDQQQVLAVFETNDKKRYQFLISRPAAMQIYETCQKIFVTITSDLQAMQNSRTMFEDVREKFVKSYDETICCLCLNNKIRIMLPCYHSYCEQCLSQWNQKNEKRSCPLCRREYGDLTHSQFQNVCFSVYNEVKESESETLINGLKVYIMSLNEEISF